MCLSLFNFALLCGHFSFDALLLLSYRCIVTINVLWLFLMVLWVGLQRAIVVNPDLTHLLFYFHTWLLKLWLRNECS